MKYKSSFYNIVIKATDEFVYLYNAYSGALCELEKRIYNELCNRILDDNHKCECFDELLKQGFLVDAEVNEYNKILLQEKMAVFSSSSTQLSFIIAPTLLCNLDCDYCFEKHFRGIKTVSDEIIIAIADYILSKVSTQITEVHIGWFGGEPLLAYNQILKFSEYFIGKIKSRKINYTASMVTNGTLLDEIKIQHLVERCHLKAIQVTVDGTEEIYCLRKKATHAQYTALLKNIEKALQYCRVSIRLNCDGKNFQDLKRVAKEIFDICGPNSKLSIYLAKLIDYKQCGDEQFLSQENFDEKKVEFNKYIASLWGIPYTPKIPKYRRSFCGLYKLKNIVIGPDGELYKCEHHLGQQDKIIGHISTGLYYNDFLMDFIRNTPRPECKNCKIFPVCVGGCPAQKFDLPDEKVCFYSQSYIKTLLLHYIEEKSST